MRSVWRGSQSAGQAGCGKVRIGQKVLRCGVVGDVRHVGSFTDSRTRRTWLRARGHRPGPSNVTAVSKAARRVARRSARSTAGPSARVRTTVHKARPRSQPRDVAVQYATKRARFAVTGSPATK